MATGSGMKALNEIAVIPPSMRNSPWAKLMMPVVLYMILKPIATMA